LRPLRRGFVGAAALALAVGTGACNKGAAEESLQEAERSLEEVRADLERHAPAELAALTRTVDEARADIEAGHYTRALRAAQGLPARIRSARATADRRKENLPAAWDELSTRVPSLIEALRVGIDRHVVTAGGASPPPREARWRSARADLGVLVEAWEGATAAYESGDVAGAVATARDITARARALADALGLAAVPHPAEADGRSTGGS
jgi:hypothetical protein